MMREIKQLTDQGAYDEAFPIIVQLRTDLTLETYRELRTVMEQEGYTMFGLYDQGSIVAVAGVAIKTNFYNKRHVYVFDLVTDQEVRSKGYGRELLTYIHQWGKDNGAVYVALDSALHRADAHRFYEEVFDYDKWCYAFRVKL